VVLAARLGPASVVFTGRHEDDLGAVSERGPGGPSPVVSLRRVGVVDRPWTWLRQVHGARVVEVREPGGEAGEEADAAITVNQKAALCVLTADCAPVAFASPEGIIGAAHAGWRGLAAGVIGATVSVMRARGASIVEAALGPCIQPECYEFSPADLDAVAAVLGEGARGRTASGAPALDLPAAVRQAIDGAGAELVYDAAVCTACGVDADGQPAWFSHRARADASRQAMVVWIP